MRRRSALRLGLGAAAGALASRVGGALPTGFPARRLLPSLPDPSRGWHGESALAATLRADATLLPGGPALAPVPRAANAGLLERFRDLRRHFVFEYYPWYATDPWRHWDQWDRRPPLDLAANAVPHLGAYDSRSRAVLEQHARWIAASGAGAVNLSWWGRDSFEDRAVHDVMDVMRDHDLEVTFHLEPYADDRATRLTTDVLHLVREFGVRRGFDAFLLLRDADGVERPVLKAFRSILPETFVDCHGITRRIPDYVADGEWRRQTDLLRAVLETELGGITLLADSLDMGRTRAAGFDGIAVYDTFVPPEAYAGLAATASSFDLLFAFNANPGFDAIEPRVVEPGSCYAPAPFLPEGAPLDWRRAEDREAAAERALARIAVSWNASLALQADPALSNARRGFCLVYLNSFNEWHEGTAFEPMLDAAALSDERRLFGYHNPGQGDYRLRALTTLLGQALTPAPGTALGVRPP